MHGASEIPRRNLPSTVDKVLETTQRTQMSKSMMHFGVVDWGLSSCYIPYLLTLSKNNGLIISEAACRRHLKHSF